MFDLLVGQSQGAMLYVVLAGDLLLYYCGRRYGQQIITHKRLHRIIPPERVDRIRHNFQRRGHWAVFFARFLVGLRSPTFLVSGVMHVPFRQFLLLDGLGALISVPLAVIWRACAIAASGGAYRGPSSALRWWGSPGSRVVNDGCGEGRRSR